MTIQEVLVKARVILKASKYNSLEAEVILGNILNKERVYLHINSDIELKKNEENRFFKELQELKEGKPLQYITGQTNWQGLDFYCNESTLIPREDTRILYEEATELIKLMGEKTVKLVEIGTGSGILPVLLKKENPTVQVYTVEKNPVTLETARKNFQKHKVEVESYLGDLLEPIKERGLKAEIIISNPPYVSHKEYLELDKEVKNEPYEALVGGADGLDFYRRIGREYKYVLNKGGYLAVEIGWQQFEAVKEIFEKCGLTLIKKAVDDGGRDRVVVLEYKDK